MVLFCIWWVGWIMPHLAEMEAPLGFLPPHGGVLFGYVLYDRGNEYDGIFIAIYNEMLRCLLTWISGVEELVTGQIFVDFTWISRRKTRALSWFFRRKKTHGAVTAVTETVTVPGQCGRCLVFIGTRWGPLGPCGSLSLSLPSPLVKRSGRVECGSAVFLNDKRQTLVTECNGCRCYCMILYGFVLRLHSL